MNRRSVLAGMAALCASAFGAQNSGSPDEGAIQAAIRHYYAVWESGDARRYRTLLTADYVLLEHGALMNVEDDVKMMPKPGSRTDTFKFQGIKVAGDTALSHRRETHDAYAYWFLESDMAGEKGATRGRWLESAVLRRSDGAWKVALLHSTRIEKK